MKNTARSKAGRQERKFDQLMFAALQDARSTLHEAVISAGMSVLSAMLETDRTRLCGERYTHDAARAASWV